MPLVNFSNLDFDQIKASIQDYLRANSNFTDYDFEGSNLSTIIDTLAYNTYITSYNTNMVTNEVFIDSATLRENVVSLSRNVGYLPRSRKASVANISFLVDVSNTTATSVTLKSGIVAISGSKSVNNKAVTFSISNDITVPVDSNGIANFTNVDIFQGTYLKQTYTVSSRNKTQKFILPNVGVDTSLLRVSVKESESSTVTRVFKQFDSLFDVGPQSPVYFLQEIDSERYEVMFGDGTFGVSLQEPNYIEINYIQCEGEVGNGISRARYAGTLRDNNNNAITSGVSLITVNEPSYGGSSIESVESIKKYSTQIYSSQNRAVTASDFEAIVPTIYPETESISAFGGEELTPPQYGKVFVSIKPTNGVFLSSTIKENIKRQINKYSVAGIITEIIDLKYLYVETNSNVYYNSNQAPNASFVSSSVTQNSKLYSNSTELNKFGARFKYSQFQRIIDESHESITSNITTVDIRRDLQATMNNFTEYEICFGNRFQILNHGHGTHQGQIGYNIRSSGFKISGISDTVYLGDSPSGDLKTGTIFLFKLNSPTEPIILRRSIGTIDYLKGEIKLNPINIISTDVFRGTNLIEISATPYSNDVIGLQDLYLQLDPFNMKVNMVTDRIASGSDVSGTNYLVSSSYANNLVRRTPIVSSSTSTDSTNSTDSGSQVIGSRVSVNTTTTSSTTTSQPSSSTSSSTSSYSY
jgi:hypothetical protein